MCIIMRCVKMISKEPSAYLKKPSIQTDKLTEPSAYAKEPKIIGKMSIKQAFLYCAVTILATQALIGCSAAGSAVGKGANYISAVPQVATEAVPFVYLGATAEEHASVSSLFRDKTKPENDAEFTNIYYTMPKNSTFYVSPELVVGDNGKEDMTIEYKDLIGNYILSHRYGKITEDVTKADYIVTVIVNKKESYVGDDSQASIKFSIVEPSRNPVFYSFLRYKSVRDPGYYYSLSTDARSADQLVVAGLSKILKDSLPQGFGEASKE